MKAVFRDILLDREFVQPLTYVQREAPFPRVPGKALAVIGVRRCGKSTYLRQIWDHLSAKEHADEDRLIHVNFFDERLFGLKAPQMGELLEAYYELHPNTKAKDPLWIFLDEPQGILGWEYFVDRLLRAHHRVFLSGSSATLLSKEIATAMRGRSLSVEIFPFSFREILQAEHQPSTQLGAKDRAGTLRRFKAYLHEGGFPETLGTTPALRRRLLQDYADSVLLRDIIERHNPSDPVALTHLMHLLMNQAGSFYTINKNCERLRAQGLKVHKAEIAKAMDWFHDSYLFFSVPIFASSLQRQMVNPKKLYGIDTGMVHHQGMSGSDNWGHLLENAVFLHLRRQTEAIAYFKDTRGREVDFIVQASHGRHALVQVAWSIRQEKTRQREIDALESAMAELSLKEATLVTCEDSEEIHLPGKTIHVIPAWSFLLDHTVK